ncbi:hypothetical protein D3C86_1591480 [compost metagenome]
MYMSFFFVDQVRYQRYMRVLAYKMLKRNLSFPCDDIIYRFFCNHRLPFVTHFRSAQQYFCIRIQGLDLPCDGQCLGDVPDITAETYYIIIDTVCGYLLRVVLNGELMHGQVGITVILVQIVQDTDGQIKMDIFRIQRREQYLGHAAKILREKGMGCEKWGSKKAK